MVALNVLHGACLISGANNRIGQVVYFVLVIIPGKASQMCLVYFDSSEILIFMCEKK